MTICRNEGAVTVVDVNTCGGVSVVDTGLVDHHHHGGPAIEIRNACKSFGSKMPVLENLDMSKYPLSGNCLHYIIFRLMYTVNKTIFLLDQFVLQPWKRALCKFSCMQCVKLFALLLHFILFYICRYTLLGSSGCGNAEIICSI
jgi:hypothetical protein